MCGFFFYISKKDLEKKEIKSLDKYSNLLKHRGPDFFGSIKYKNVFNVF